MKSFFLAADGDDIGRKIELLIVTNQIDVLSEFFKDFQSSMFWLSEKLKNDFDATIIFNGGDNVLAKIQIEEIQIKKIENLRNNFFNRSKATLSFGIGLSPRQAYFALKLAKASGKNRTEIFQECIND